MSGKKARKERRVIAEKSQQLIGKIATDELVIHYETIYAKYIAAHRKCMFLQTQILGGRVMLAIGILLTAAAIWSRYHV